MDTATELARLFDLVAPIAITGGADLCYQDKAEAAWKEIIANPTLRWAAYGCPDPFDLLENEVIRDISGGENFSWVYEYFALPSYEQLLEELVAEHGDGKWEAGERDYWGAKGFKRPGDHSKSLSFAGDSYGHYMWFTCAEAVIEHITRREEMD